MKIQHLLSSAAIAAILVSAPANTFAQTASDRTGTATTSDNVVRAHDDDGPDYGWIGLLGLLGLAGLMRKRHDNHTHVGTTTTRNP